MAGKNMARSSRLKKAMEQIRAQLLADPIALGNRLREYLSSGAMEEADVEPSLLKFARDMHERILVHDKITDGQWRALAGVVGFVQLKREEKEAGR